jgi:hypothetical protein
MLHRLLAFLVVAVPLAAVGCGGPKPVAVSGKVTYKQKLLAQGSITFTPEKGRMATGKIRDGMIVEVTTHNLNDGALEGHNKVAIRSVSNPDDMYAEHVSLIPDKYGDPEKSGLTADLKPGENVLTFDLDE